MSDSIKAPSPWPLTLAALLVALLVLLLARTEEGVPAVVTLLALGGGGLWLVLLSPGREARRAVALIFGVALGLRVLVAVLVYYWDPLFFSLDQVSYFLRGASLAEQWRAQGGPEMGWLLPIHIERETGLNRFAEMWALLSYLVGASELALRTAMGVVGAYTAARVYLLGKELFGEKAGLISGWLAACWPSLIIWSAQGLRDPLLVLLWCEAGLAVLRVCGRRQLSGLLGLGATMYAFILLRPYVAVWASRGVALALLLASMRGGRSAKLLAIGWTGLVLLVGGVGFLGQDYLRGADLGTATEIHRAFEEGGSSFAAEVDLSTYTAALRYLPVGITYFLLAPFPWQTGSALQMSTMLEQPIWYAALALAMAGLISAVRKRTPVSVAMIAVLAPAVVFYGLVMSNVGTAYRNRAQFMPFVFVYAAEGAVAWQMRRPRARSHVAQGKLRRLALASDPAGGAAAVRETGRGAGCLPAVGRARDLPMRGGWE